MYFWRVGIDGRSYTAAPTQVSTVVTPPAPAAQHLGVKTKKGGEEEGRCEGAAGAGGKQFGSCAAG